MSDETKKEKAGPEELSDEQLDQVSGGATKRRVKTTTTNLSSDEKLTTDSSDLAARR
jgi:bacteriocin-like protein